MCGRYVSPDDAAIERAWHVGRHNNIPFARCFNVAPTAAVPVLRLQRETGVLELTSARWGLIPHWWKAARPPNFCFNARVEDVAAKPMWRDAWRRTRCLVPAEGWYEWQARDDPPGAERRAPRRKQPYFIRRRDRRLMCFAGLCSRWTNPESGEAVASCAILTTQAAGALASIHERMPVVAAEAWQGAWLDPEMTDGVKIAALMDAAAPEGVEHYPVSTRVNDARADDAGLTEPLGAGGA